MQIAVVPSLNLPGLCDVPTDCGRVASRLASDGSDDTLWYAPQLSERTSRLITAGELRRR